MVERRRYTAKQKAQAVGIAAAAGVTQAERETGIPKTTIQYWTQQPDFVRLRTTARDALVDQFWVAVQIGLEQVVDGLKGDASLKDKAVALATVYDRHALLTGGATARSENRDITGSISDADIAATVRTAVALTAGGRAAETAPIETASEGLQPLPD